MSLTLKTGLTAPKDFIEDVFEIDKYTYSPELCGLKENLYNRYNRCPDSFLLLYDNEDLIGYINFFPVGDALFAQLNDITNYKLRDDDILPEELNDWQKDKPNNIFIISIVILPKYRGSEAIIRLGNSFLEFLREKEANGYKINSISGTAVSDKGKKFLKRFRGSFVKFTEDNYEYYITKDENIRKLIKDGILLKNI